MKSKPRKNSLSPVLEGSLETGKPVGNSAVKLMREDGRALITEVKGQRTGGPGRQSCALTNSGGEGACFRSLSPAGRDRAREFSQFLRLNS